MRTFSLTFVAASLIASAALAQSLSGNVGRPERAVPQAGNTTRGPIDNPSAYGAYRNADGRVIMYADHITGSMERAMAETERRRAGIGTILARGYGLYGYLETYGRFAGHGYRVLPLDEFHRYGFVDLPASDDAVDWPVLVAVHVSGTEPPTGPPAAIANANPPAQWFTRIVRPAADGAPASAIDLYRLERPETPLFGSD